jgi:Protein of unknown function (DUF1553)
VQRELLDWLASTFTEQGWSLKKLHRTILLSSTWMQDSVHPSQIAATNQQSAIKNPQSVDPENRLLWRQSRQRLEWEAMHDALLAAAGKLDETIGGRPVKLFNEPYPQRRAVYAYIDRQNLPGTLRTFDFASPDLMNPQRSTTSVPQQALYMMNSPFVIAQAEALTDAPDFSSTAPEERHVQMLYERVLARKATPAEVKIAVDYVKAAQTAQRTPPPIPAWRYGYGTYDAEMRKVSFTPLTHWSGTAWQVGPKLPDAKMGFVHLTADGGHPSRDVAAIRRFTASREMTVSLSGEIVHAASSGNGIHARIVSSHAGQNMRRDRRRRYQAPLIASNSPRARRSTSSSRARARTTATASPGAPRCMPPTGFPTTQRNSSPARRRRSSPSPRGSASRRCCWRRMSFCSWTR